MPLFGSIYGCISTYKRQAAYRMWSGERLLQALECYVVNCKKISLQCFNTPYLNNNTQLPDDCSWSTVHALLYVAPPRNRPYVHKFRLPWHSYVRLDKCECQSNLRTGTNIREFRDIMAFYCIIYMAVYGLMKTYRRICGSGCLVSICI